MAVFSSPQQPGVLSFLLLLLFLFTTSIHAIPPPPPPPPSKGPEGLHGHGLPLSLSPADLGRLPVTIGHANSATCGPYKALKANTQPLETCSVSSAEQCKKKCFDNSACRSFAFSHDDHRHISTCRTFSHVASSYVVPSGPIWAMVYDRSCFQAAISTSTAEKASTSSKAVVAVQSSTRSTSRPLSTLRGSSSSSLITTTSGSSSNSMHGGSSSSLSRFSSSSIGATSTPSSSVRFITTYDSSILSSTSLMSSSSIISSVGVPTSSSSSSFSSGSSSSFAGSSTSISSVSSSINTSPATSATSTSPAGSSGPTSSSTSTIAVSSTTASSSTSSTSPASSSSTSTSSAIATASSLATTSSTQSSSASSPTFVDFSGAIVVAASVTTDSNGNPQLNFDPSASNPVSLVEKPLSQVSAGSPIAISGTYTVIIPPTATLIVERGRRRDASGCTLAVIYGDTTIMTTSLDSDSDATSFITSNFTPNSTTEALEFVETCSGSTYALLQMNDLGVVVAETTSSSSSSSAAATTGPESASVAVESSVIAPITITSTTTTSTSTSTSTSTNGEGLAEIPTAALLATTVQTLTSTIAATSTSTSTTTSTTTSVKTYCTQAAIPTPTSASCGLHGTQTLGLFSNRSDNTAGSGQGSPTCAGRCEAMGDCASFAWNLVYGNCDYYGVSIEGGNFTAGTTNGNSYIYHFDIGCWSCPTGYYH